MMIDVPMLAADFPTLYIPSGQIFVVKICEAS